MKKVFDYLQNSINLNSNDVIVVGVSSGPDSMALLHILNEFRKRINFKIVVAHVNHNIRKESKDEALFLEKYCKLLDVTYEYMKIEKYSEDNFHNQARNIRYDFYKSLIKKYSANYLMTGHHADDLMETILMRIVRGSSLKGYSGFAPCITMNDYKIVRPLIFVTKEEIELYNKQEGIVYCVDKSNSKDIYTRNRYRKNILPFLKEEDSNVHCKFLKFSNTLIEYDKHIENEMYASLNLVYTNGLIDVLKFVKLPFLIQERIVNYLFEKIYMDDLFLINDKHIDLFFRIINSKKSNLACNLPNNYLLVKSYQHIYFKKIVDDLSNYDLPLEDYMKLSNGMVLERIIASESNGNDVLRLSSNDVLLPLRVRTRKNGDRIQTLNGGTKKVKDIFIEKKIPIDKRDSWPIIVDSLDKIVWIPKLKKSKFNRLKSDSCDIIFRCS